MNPPTTIRFHAAGRSDTCASSSHKNPKILKKNSWASDTTEPISLRFSTYTMIFPCENFSMFFWLFHGLQQGFSGHHHDTSWCCDQPRVKSQTGGKHVGFLYTNWWNGIQCGDHDVPVRIYRSDHPELIASISFSHVLMDLLGNPSFSTPMR